MFYKLYLKFIGKNWQLYILYLITLLVIPIENTFMPHYYGNIISSIKSSDMSTSKKLFMVLIFLWIIIQILNLTQSYVNMYIMPKFESFIRQYFFDKIIDSYSQNYQELEIGKIISMIIRSPGIVQSIFIETKDFLIQNMFTFISNIVYFSSYSWELALIYIGSILTIYLVTYIYYLDCHKYIESSQESYDSIYEEIQDTLANLISIYTSQESKNEKMRIRSLNSKNVENVRESLMCNNKYRLLFSIIYIIIFLLLNYTAYRLYNSKKINLTGFVGIFVINYTIFKHIGVLYYDAYAFIRMYTKVNYITNYVESLPVYANTSEINIPAEPINDGDSSFKDVIYEDFNNAVEKIIQSHHNDVKKIDIELKDLVFSHSPKIPPIYNGLNLKVPFGQKLAVMGTIGSGKSTMAKLIVRLQKHQAGDILINGVPVEKINIINLRYHITYIPQHPILFNRTLWDNISYGLDKSITEDNFYNILLENEMNDLVEIYKSKMHKKVGKTGSNLSGGQRQIIWLIRCILRPSKVILLDEPTSALDEKNKNNVMKLIEKLGQNRTLIVITHDRDLLKYMDRMIFFDKGQIVDDKEL